MPLADRVLAECPLSRFFLFLQHRLLTNTEQHAPRKSAARIYQPVFRQAIGNRSYVVLEEIPKQTYRQTALPSNAREHGFDKPPVQLDTENGVRDAEGRAIGG